MFEGGWSNAAAEFNRNVLPRLRRWGKEIGNQFRAGSPEAKAVVHYYSMLHRSFDPVTALLVEQSLDAWEKTQPKEQTMPTSEREPITANKLSTGDDSTLGNYRKLCIAHFGAESKAVQFIDKKIAESPHGENEVVIQNESQMLWLLTHEHHKG